MKARIDETCTACGLCVDTCPDVFQFRNEMVYVTVDPIPYRFEDTVEQAAEECPVEAILTE